MWFVYVFILVIIWVLAIVFRNKLKIDVMGFILIRKTQKLNSFIDTIANKNPKFWKILMTLGIIIATGIMVLTLYSLLIDLIPLLLEHLAPQTSITDISSQADVSLLIPGFNIPLIYGLIAIAVAIIVHEMGHGILARAENIGLKSVGVFLLIALPGAFVEPNEKQIENLNKISKLRIYAAGPIFNLILATITTVTYTQLFLLYKNINYGEGLSWLLFEFITLLYWISYINLGIGTFNLLPLKPLDGGKILEELLKHVTTNKAKKITNIASIITLTTIIIHLTL